MEPLSPAVSEQMRRQRTRDTPAELSLRSELHRRGVRFRVHRRLLSGVRREVDIVIPKARIAVLVDGCFWHGCPIHGAIPKNNSDAWRRKLADNRARDIDTDDRLARAGWTVVRVWEHVAADDAAAEICDLIAGGSQPG
jgi:DNA mismatch endonuclease, patch repair protein